jgi:hypothetical protein
MVQKRGTLLVSRRTFAFAMDEIQHSRRTDDAAAPVREQERSSAVETLASPLCEMWPRRRTSASIELAP